MAAGFHVGTHFGFERGHPMMRADMHRDMHGRHGERDHWGEHGRSDYFAHASFGHWVRRSGFGGNAGSHSIADGQWHAGGEFR